jgi:hypothetical protein
MSAVTGSATVYMVKKRGGVDDGSFYAMKIVRKDFVIKHNSYEYVMQERDVLKKAIGAPFLMGLKYAFETKGGLCFVMGEYVKNNMHYWKSTITASAGPCRAASTVSQTAV